MPEPLRLAGVGKRYGLRGRWVLQQVDLELEPGSLVRIKGPNGGGKSTLLRLIAGIIRPSTGTVRGGGSRAYVPERFSAALPFDARGYLARLGAVHGLPADTARERADHWLERLGAAEWHRAPLAALSKGMAQKVAVAQALMAEPDLLVLDEAWTGLDAAARIVLDRAVDERVEAGGSVIFVDHYRGWRVGRPVTAYRLEEGTLRFSPEHGRAPDDDAEAVAVGAAPAGAQDREPVAGTGSGRPGGDPGEAYLDHDDLVEIVVEAGNAGPDDEVEDPESMTDRARALRALGDTRARLTVSVEESDAVLRELLAVPGTHIRSLRRLPVGVPEQEAELT